MKESDPILKVAAKAAIVDATGKVLIVREASTGKDTTQVGRWSLIGGRLDPGEAFLDGLKREVQEEVGATVEVVKPLYVGEWRPVIRNVPHQIIGIFMLCRAVDDRIKLSDEHDKFAWIDPAERRQYEMVEPDCFVVDGLVDEKAT